nr:hypothetical protein [Tanacetum cinerariifolium]
MSLDLAFEHSLKSRVRSCLVLTVSWTMYMTIDQQVALDEALVPHSSRLRIRKSNFRLRSDITSKESTLQLVYNVLRLTPFYKAFLVTTDVPKIYIEMLHICPRLPGQTFDELPFEEEILAFLRFLGHSGKIRKLTDVNINKLHQPWRSFAAVINKCLSGKSTGYDSLRLSQAQILWGMYHKKNVDFAYLMWEDFVYQVEHKDAKKSNEMYCPRFTKMFTTIKLVSRHQNTQQFDVMLLVELTNEDIRNSEAYKEYYAVVSGAAPPKTKASVRKTKSSSDTTITPPTVADTRLSTSAKGKQLAKPSKAKGLTVLSEVAMTKAEQMTLTTKRSLQQTYISQSSSSGADERTGIIPGFLNVPTDESNEEISWKSSDEDDDDEVDERSDDQDDDDDDKDDDDQDDNDDDQETDNEVMTLYILSYIFMKKKLKMRKALIPSEKGQDAEDDDDALYRDVNINLKGRDVQMTDVHTTQEFEDTHVTLTPVNPDGQQQIAPVTLTAPTLSPSTIPTISQVPQEPTPLTTAPSTFLQDLPNFGSLFGFDHRLKTLKANFSEFLQTNQFARAIFSIPKIVERYMDQRMNEEIKVAIQIQSDRLQDEAQAKNEKFLNNLDENIQKIIKEQVKEQVKVQVSNILPKIEKTMNEQLEAKVLTRSSNSSKTSYAVTADLSEMELKKILIEKMESNKSIQRSDEQRNLYKALVDAYESNKIILDTYGDTVTLKRSRDDADKDEEPFAGSDRRTVSESAPTKEPMQTTQDLEKPSHQEFEIATYESIQPWISDLAKQADSRSSFNEPMDKPVDFSAFLMNRLKVDTLTPELLVGPTHELMKGSCKSLVELEFFLEEVYKATTEQLDWNNPKGQRYPHNLLKPLPLIPNSRGRRVIPFDHFINNDLEYLRVGASNHKYTTSITKTKAVNYGHMKWIKDLFYGFAVNRESARDVYSKCRIIAVTKLQIVEWHDYKHLDWITVRRDNDKLYKFKEERFAFNVSLRMFTRSIIIQRRVEDLQLGVKSYQKKLNLTKPDTCCTDLKRKEAYIAYSNPRGFTYQNKDKQNRLMWIDELHKLSDGTLNDVRTALDDRLKGIRMKYLPQAIWRKSDKERAAAMI